MAREAIKDRLVYVYLPSVKLLTDWKARAAKSKVPISKFVLEHVMNSIRQEEGEEDYKPRAKLIEELRVKDETIEKLTRDSGVLKLALERVETELRKYHAEPFLEDNFRGVRRYDKRLIELLRKGEVVDSDHLLRLLRINLKEIDLVRAVSKQLENLEAYGLVEKTRRGWRWVS
ncbi:MAG TPA: hypothetical protein VJZ32_03890 [Candidatus Bathyarchaeia archaeon]|nr:hypothetical protein [Candidatus Bathyarchaeia archaeon]